ncbi:MULTISPECIES: acetyl/propionyl/methylcrotonyl-CoA carboxylase subunit alpha [Achromobacter]|uniref:Acetyl-/propionyl-coenzyme A carboxylase alpha chain n=1 Tax=Achromobacter mucicolens TaxID=1389922 RepID=A0ABM8LK44_9BURK|nr:MULTISPECIES: biotin carboxylase N-terminal domain-containing protein [Achromobacter]AVG44081.1 carbamoyl-phosphate synthase subunit L [Achromobacter insolitus]CAB3848274.1 Acetyl-/propionyl-coenzyme A carboxylase alpha chain [Achromobacter aegrifaciens]CAB3911834.1 Acetyl-/propionyl-coenzyme A carboxylase alpha chain [Achromobacter mucicolens]
MFKRILIANRGEIARRIARTCQRLGIEYVSVHSLADAGAAHLRGAARTVCLGAGAAADSYLNAGKLLQAARDTGCEAVHPGYGFLSENSEFAASVEAAGMTFIGPSPATIAALGDKARAKALMRAAGVPVVPGTDEASDNPATVEALARAIELPILLKPSAGGGGKGMQIITQYEDLPRLIESAIRLARSSFGDGQMIVERYIEEPRHIEVQVFGDGHGNVVHLFERECSLQRRHQKVMEEAPAPRLPERARQRLLDAAVQGARSLDYRNAGTFEFIMDRDFNCYFLEVNTRLQVEHPVTEAVTGLDLVEWQFRVAAGQALPLLQSEISCCGHAIEARIYAEDPAQDFRPSPGKVVHARWPADLRVDTALDDAGEIPPFYDPMVAKIIASAADRRAALAGLKAGLGQTALLGVASNLGYLLRLLDDPGVLAGQVHTRYLDEHKSLQIPSSRRAAGAVCATLALPLPGEAAAPWHPGTSCGAMDRKFLDPDAPLGRVRFLLDSEPAWGTLHGVDGANVRAGDGQQSWNVSRDAFGLGGMVDGWRWDACLAAEGWNLQVAGDHYTVRPVLPEGDASAQDVGGAMAPMSGVIAAVSVQPGDRVRPGDVLAVMEAMKMEYSIVADVEGTVAHLRYGPGDSVREGELIADIIQAATVGDDAGHIDEPSFQAGSSR